MRFFSLMNFFVIFFRNFLAGVEYERNSGLKFFSLFLGLSHPILARNNASKFLSFWYFLVFFGNFLAWVEYERNSGLDFVSIFLGLSYPVLARNNAGKRFFNFLNFLGIFSELSWPGRVWTEFGSTIFFSLSRPITSRFG